MGIWQRFKTWLFREEERSGSRYQPQDINADEIAKELGVKEEAKRLGEAGQPAADSIVPTGIEVKIVARINKARIPHIEWASSRLRILNADLSKLDITPIAGRAAQADKEFDRQAGALLTDRKHILQALKEETLQCGRSLDEFKRQNGLARSARYPSGARWFFQMAMLAVLVVIEGVFNSVLFAKGIDGGLIGGFLYAAGFALGNVLVATLLGRFVVPNVFHQETLRKAVGVLGLLAALAVMALISLVIAHFRDALVADAVSPGRVALQSFSHPFALDDLMSWWLLGLSLLVGVGALLDGIFLDEVYPGYGRHAREANEAEGAYRDELEDLRDEMNELKVNALNQLNHEIKLAQSNLNRREELLKKKADEEQRLLHSMVYAKRCLQALIFDFRGENIFHRKGIPSPAYFPVMPVLDHLELPDFEMESSHVTYAEQHERLKALLSQVQDIRTAIQSAFTHKFEMLKSLDDHFEPESAPSSFRMVAL